MRCFCWARICRRAEDEAWTEGGASAGMGVVRPLQAKVSYEAMYIALLSRAVPRDARARLLERSVLVEDIIGKLGLQQIDSVWLARSWRVYLSVPVARCRVERGSLGHHKGEDRCMTSVCAEKLDWQRGQPRQMICDGTGFLGCCQISPCFPSHSTLQRV